MPEPPPFPGDGRLRECRRRVVPGRPGLSPASRRTREIRREPGRDVADLRGQRRDDLGQSAVPGPAPESQGGRVLAL